MSLSADELLSSAPAALLAVNLNGEVLAHSAGLARWFGRGQAPVAPDLRGMNLVTWLTPASRLLYETRIVPQLLDAGSVREAVLEVRDGGGRTHPVMINADLRRRESGDQAVFIAVLDAVDRVTFERELVAARRAAEVAHERLSVLQDATSRLAIAEGVDDLGEALAAAAARATQASWTAVCISGGRLATGTGSRDAWGGPPDGLDRSAMPAVEEQTVCRSPEEIAERFPEVAETLATAGAVALVVTPILRVRGDSFQVLGGIHCWFRRSRTLDEETLETLRALAAQAELVMDHLTLQERLRHRALHDELTGLANRVLLEERLDGFVASAARSGQPCSVLFLDLDGFKGINDRLGHGVGDDVLREVAERLRASCRRGEVVSRLGGDEFVVAAAGVAGPAAAEIARRIWTAIRAPLEGSAAGSPLSSSIGVVSWDGQDRDAAPTATELIAAADAEMYRAKRGGKDAISVREWRAMSRV